MGQALRVYLAAEERSYLENLINDGSHSSQLLQRARTLLLADRTSGEWNRYEKIADLLQSSTSVVSHICRRYVTHGLKAALSNQPKLGRVGKISKDVESHLVLLIRSEPPAGQSHWTLKLLAEQFIALGLVDSISEVSLHKYLKKKGLSIKNLKYNNTLDQINIRNGILD